MNIKTMKMKNIKWALLLALGFAACNNSAQTEESGAAAEEPKMEETAAPVASGPKDPICDMPKEDSWTSYSVQGTDTVWFCSETCKEVFDKNPSKYMDKTKS